MQMDSTIRTTLIVFTLIILSGLIVSAHCNAEEGCYEQAEHRPCISGTVSYDYNDMECECLTPHGELEWSIYAGCDLD